MDRLSACVRDRDRVPYERMKVARGIVTPELAQRMLAQNEGPQRSVNRWHVDFLADQMRAGLFMENGQSITFDSDGNLLDGQHRLHACIKANTPFSTIVVRGVGAAAWPTIDTGMIRSLAHELQAKGTRNATTVASSARFAISLETGAFGKTGSNAGKRIPHVEALSWIARNPAIAEYARVCAACKVFSGPRGLVAGIWFLVARDGSDVDAFFHGLLTGEDLRAGSPVLQLRTRLMDRSQRGRAAKDTMAVRAALVLKAFNLWWRGKTASTIPAPKPGHLYETVRRLVETYCMNPKPAAGSADLELVAEAAE
jgi:hypothetical protein